MRMSIFTVLVLLAVGSASQAVTVLQTDFNGRTVSGATASNLIWATNGVADPGSLTVMEPAPVLPALALFDTASAQNRIAVDRNIHNEGPWFFDVPLSVGGAGINLGQVSLDALIYNNSGAVNVMRDLDMTVSLLDASMLTLDTDTVLNIFPGSGGTASPTLVTFDLSGNTLAANTNYFLRIAATGQGPGNNAGFDNLLVEGELVAAAIPEPSTFIGLGAVAMAGLWRRRRAA